MAKKHFLCVDLIDPKTKEQETCYLANMDLRALYKYTSFCDGADELLDNLKYCDDQIEDLIRNNLSTKLNRDTFYLKEHNNQFSYPFKVLYKKDEDVLYITTSELSKILKKHFKIYDFQFFTSEFTKNQEEIYQFLFKQIQNKKSLGEDKAFMIEDEIHSNFFCKYGLDSTNNDYIDAYDWQELGLVDHNITLSVNYLCKDLHTKVILGMMIKKAMNVKSLLSNNDINYRRAFWNKKFIEENKNYKYVNDQISNSVRNFYIKK